MVVLYQKMRRLLVNTPRPKRRQAHVGSPEGRVIISETMQTTQQPEMFVFYYVELRNGHDRQRW